MKLIFNIKSLGKKRPYLNKETIEIAIPSSTTVKELLKAIVIQQVNAFNARKDERNLISFVDEEKISNEIASGRITFNEQYNAKKANSEEAIETVHQAFEDGLIAIFINDDQFENIDQSIELKESDSITLIKLTFLSGGIW